MKYLIYLLLTLPVFCQYQDIFTDDANTLAHWEFNQSYEEYSGRNTMLIAGSWTPTYKELSNGVWGLQSSGDGTKFLYIDIGDDANLRLPSPGVYTLEFVLSVDTLYDQMVMEHSGGTLASGWSLNFYNAANQHKIRFGAYDQPDGDATNAIMTNAPSDSTLYYVCVYLDYGDSLTMWVNNVKQTSGNMTGITQLATTTDAQIGQWSFLSTFPFRGQIYGIRISDKLRTNDERVAVWSFLQDIPAVETQKKKKYNGWSGSKKY